MEWFAPVLILAGVIVTAVVSGGVTYFVARRNTSGNISTSDAASLWEESNNLRKDYRERAEALEEQLKTVNKKLEDVMDELGKVRSNSAKMLEKISELKGIINDLRKENKRLLKALEKERAP